MAISGTETVKWEVTSSPDGCISSPEASSSPKNRSLVAWGSVRRRMPEGHIEGVFGRDFEATRRALLRAGMDQFTKMSKKMNLVCKVKIEHRFRRITCSTVAADSEDEDANARIASTAARRRAAAKAHKLVTDSDDESFRAGRGERLTQTRASTVSSLPAARNSAKNESTAASPVATGSVTKAAARAAASFLGRHGNSSKVVSDNLSNEKIPASKRDALHKNQQSPTRSPEKNALRIDAAECAPGKQQTRELRQRSSPKGLLCSATSADAAAVGVAGDHGHDDRRLWSMVRDKIKQCRTIYNDTDHAPSPTSPKRRAGDGGGEREGEGRKVTAWQPWLHETKTDTHAHTHTSQQANPNEMERERERDRA